LEEDNLYGIDIDIEISLSTFTEPSLGLWLWRPLKPVTLRILILENSLEKQQIRASAWASYLTGIGSIVSYFCGFVDLPRIFRADSLTQFQSLSLVAHFMIIITVTVSCLWVTEKVSART